MTKILTDFLAVLVAPALVPFRAGACHGPPGEGVVHRAHGIWRARTRRVAWVLALTINTGQLAGTLHVASAAEINNN